MLPERVRLSQKATEKLRYVKSRTGVTPNILARFSIMLAIREGKSFKDFSITEFSGLEINKSALFGEHAPVYEVLIKQYMHDNSLNMPAFQVISSLIEAGISQLEHVKSFADLCDL